MKKHPIEITFTTHTYTYGGTLNDPLVEQRFFLAIKVLPKGSGKSKKFAEMRITDCEGRKISWLESLPRTTPEHYKALGDDAYCKDAFNLDRIQPGAIFGISVFDMTTGNEIDTLAILLTEESRQIFIDAAYPYPHITVYARNVKYCRGIRPSK